MFEVFWAKGRAQKAKVRGQREYKICNKKSKPFLKTCFENIYKKFAFCVLPSAL
jgi:hypothetical protein